MPSYDVIVIGGGLIGLATARALVERNPRLRLTVVEKERGAAEHQSGRNSGVIHAGLYYAAGSLKARLCREGRAALLRYAEDRGIPYRLDGKLVVAVDDSELGPLEELARRGRENGLEGMREVSARELQEIEPNVVGTRALHVPETGSIDYRLVAQHYADDVRAAGGDLLFGRRVVGITMSGPERIVATNQGEVRAGCVVTCGGVQADRLARMTGNRMDELRIVPFRGDYFVLGSDARRLVRGHVYPVPDPAFPFLGVHFSRRIDGEVWAGPNAVPSFAREGYGRLSVNARDLKDAVSFPGTWRMARKYYRTGLGEMYRDAVKAAAVREMRRYIPELKGEDVHLGPSGIRAQLVRRDGTLADDFLVARATGVVHVLNVPSPAATASLAIGRLVADEAAKSLDLNR